MATLKKPRKQLTDRQKRKIAWVKTHGGFDKRTDDGEATEQKPKPVPKSSPKKDPKIIESETRKQAEGAARGFKRKIAVSQVDEGGSKKAKTDTKLLDNSPNASDSDNDNQATTKVKFPSNNSASVIANETDITAESIIAAKPAVTVREILGIKEKVTEVQKKKEKKKKHYVLFVGNLPYDVDEGDIAAHFIQAGEVKDVRRLTNDKGPKGCAFVEFYTEKAHKAALMMHHTMLNDRTINVEFTAPGRKNTQRDETIKKKNEQGKRFKMGFGVSVRKNRPVQSGKIKVKSKQR